MNDLHRQFGKYEILGELGRGGFAIVYRARDTKLQRQVALKILDPTRGWEPDFATRFLQEAQAAAQLKHPHIITIYEIDDVDGQLYIAMELAEGGSLRQALQEQPGGFDVAAATGLLAQAAAALDHAHARGMVHRDVKPANILLDVDAKGAQRAILSDFGMVKALAQSTELTQSGAILGTVEYMAPEQADSARSAEISPATDIYALGVTAYHLLTGQTPFTGSTVQVLMAHASKAPPPPSELRADLPPLVSDAILRALAKQPGDRFPTATAFVQALAAATEPAPAAEAAPATEPAFTAASPAPPPAAPEKKQGRGPIPVAAILTVIVAAAILFGARAVLRRQAAASRATPTTAATTPVAIDCDALVATVSALSNQNNCESAVARADEAIAAGCQDRSLWENRAICYTMLGQSDRALTDFATALDMNPGDAWTYINRSYAYEQQGRLPEALADLTQAITLQPGNASFYFSRAHIYKQLAQLKDALADLTAAIDLEPANAEYYLNRGDLYERLGELPAAAADFAQFVALAAGDDAWADYRAARQQWLQTYQAGLVTPMPATTATPTSTSTAIPATATPAQPVALVNSVANVRSGPGTQYDRIGVAAVGQRFDIKGKNGAETWWQIDFNGRAGWLFADLVSAEGDLGRVSVAPAPPTPTRVPPTATPVPPTPTPVPSTPVPPTATTVPPTSARPTPTPVPPATPTPAPP